MIRIVLTILIFIFFNSSLTIGQQKDLSPEEYQIFLDELGYNKTKKGLRIRKEFIPDHNDLDLVEEDSVEITKSGFSILKIIAFVLIILLVVFILYMIFANVQVDKKINAQAINVKEIEDIEDVDAREAYKQAIQQEDYLLAIRMHFLICLQELNQSKRIDWEQEKTNRDYYREIESAEIKKPFREIANIFERCCYADVTLNLTEFNRYDQRFLDFLNMIK